MDILGVPMQSEWPIKDKGATLKPSKMFFLEQVRGHGQHVSRTPLLFWWLEGH